MNQPITTRPNGDFNVARNIVVYSQANCPGCNALKAQLTQAGYAFEEVRIDLDIEQKKFIFNRGHRSVPVMYVNGQHMTLAQLKESQ